MTTDHGIVLTKEDRKRAVEALQEYAEENFDEGMGDLKAGLLLDFILRELGPTVYNQALRDARAFIEERAADVEGVLHKTEFPGWSRR